MTNDLTGVWFGEYAYPVGEAPVAFIANLDERDGVIAGRVDEPNTFGMPYAQRLFAHLSGTRTDNLVVLTKTYDGTGGATHSVSYTGEVSADGDMIEGIWRTRGWSGRFTMSRPAVAPADAREAFAQSVDS